MKVGVWTGQDDTGIRKRLARGPWWVKGRQQCCGKLCIMGGRELCGIQKSMNGWWQEESFAEVEDKVNAWSQSGSGLRPGGVLTGGTL